MKTVRLAGKILGAAGDTPMVVLHGLLGSGRNWMGTARHLVPPFQMHLLDARNHGESPHAETMDYPSMAADVRAWLDRAGLERVVLVGHSMGGKAAMTLAVAHPERISHLVVVDMAPKAYAPRWEAEFAAMRALPVDRMQSRQEAEAALEGTVRDWAFRKFLLTNLRRAEKGGFEWMINLPLLQSRLPDLFAQPLEETAVFRGPTLFIRGAGSNFIVDADQATIRRHFPDARLETVEGAGHNVHFDQPERFAKLLREFVADCPA